jgi:hypothetical protein
MNAEARRRRWRRGEKCGEYFGKSERQDVKAAKVGNAKGFFGENTAIFQFGPQALPHFLALLILAALASWRSILPHFLSPSSLCASAPLRSLPHSTRFTGTKCSGISASPTADW